MYLKSIHLRGFKSFGVKTVLLFEPGINVIVGPNGSGKSNIVDAISWVLGEQSPKSLRSSSMGDIIFRSKNDELAIADVSLIFDNSDNILPIEFNEVKFTRRGYLKGGCDYFINSSPCRLTDIYDLIAESGIGKGLYTIISQGQVNNIILYKPSEKKQVIDEIIGISRHKIKRDKSKDKLENIENDINRISDLLFEVKRTMDPLEIEAQKSREFLKLTQELKNNEISLFLSNINNLNKKWEEENKNYEKNSKDLSEITKRINLINEQKKEIENEYYRQKENFNKINEKNNIFNVFYNKLNNIKSIILNQKTGIDTVTNMINFSINNVKNGYNNKENESLKIEKNNILLNEKIKGIIRKIDEIYEISNNFFKNNINWFKDEYLEQVKNFYELLNLKLSSLKNTINSELTTSKAKEKITLNKNDFQEDNVKDNIENNINDRLKKLNEIKEIAILNIKNIDLLLKILNKLLNLSEKIKNKLIIDTKNEKEKSEYFSNKLSNFYEELNKLNSKRNFLENEIYRGNLRKEQIKDKVKDLSIKIYDDYNMSVDYIVKNFKPADNEKECELKIKSLKSELSNYKNVNPNAYIEYEKIKERYEFLSNQKNDLVESKKNLIKIIDELNQKIRQFFNEKFYEINENFKYYFKILFPSGEGELLLVDSENENEDFGIDIKADIGNNKSVSLQLLSGGEKALVSVAYLFSIFSVNYSPFYIFDEIDASLDDANLLRFINLVKIFSQGRQIIMITHQKKTMEVADIIYGFSMQSNGITKVVSEKIKNNYVKAI